MVGSVTNLKQSFKLDEFFFVNKIMKEYICNASLCSTSLCTQKNKLSYTTLFIIIISSFFYVGDVAARSYSFDASLLNGGGKG